MEDQSLVRSAKTVEEAIELATLELGVGRDEIAVDVISEGRPGIFGIGAEPAKVRVRLLTDNDGDSGDDSDDSTTSAALNIVYDFLDLLDVDADATVRKEGSELDDQPVIDIQGEDAGLLIGNRGETLRSLQFLVNMVLSRTEGRSAGVTLDVAQYRERRMHQLGALAERMAKRAVANGDSVALDAMSPADRRIIHFSLANFAGVRTESSGEGNDRHVVIYSTGDGSSASGNSGRRGRRPNSGR